MKISKKTNQDVNPNRVSFPVHVDKELKIAIDVFRAKVSWSRSKFIAIACEEYLKKNQS